MSYAIGNVSARRARKRNGCGLRKGKHNNFLTLFRQLTLALYNAYVQFHRVHTYTVNNRTFLTVTFLVTKRQTETNYTVYYKSLYNCNAMEIRACTIHLRIIRIPYTYTYVYLKPFCDSGSIHWVPQQSVVVSLNNSKYTATGPKCATSQLPIRL